VLRVWLKERKGTPSDPVFPSCRRSALSLCVFRRSRPPSPSHAVQSFRACRPPRQEGAVAELEKVIRRTFCSWSPWSSRSAGASIRP
jgi:hypothetical protein